MRHALRIGDIEHIVWLSRASDGYRLHLDDVTLPVSLTHVAGNAFKLRVGTTWHDMLIATDGDIVHVHFDGETFALRYADPVVRHAGHGGSSADDVAEAPMPGVVVAVSVHEGATVARGDTLVVIESMKLETAIKAWRDGVVATLHVAQGQVFDRGAALVTLAPQGGA
jgi:3-methylcrotonyl-CoA carboxylase alpha subunit